MERGDQRITVPQDALWAISADLADANVDDLDQVIVQALAAAAQSVGAAIAGMWRTNLDTGYRTERHVWIEPGLEVPPMPKTSRVSNARLLSEVEHGAIVVPLVEIANAPGSTDPNWVDGTAAIIKVGRDDPFLDTVAFVRQSGAWSPSEVQRLNGFGAILRQFIRRAATEKQLQLRLHLAETIRDCVAFLSHADVATYDHAVQSTLERIAQGFDLTAVGLVQFGPERATTEHFVGESTPAYWLDLETLGIRRFVSADSGPQRHLLSEVARAFFGDDSPAVREAAGQELSLVPAQVRSSTPALLAAISPIRDWHDFETEALELVSQSLIETRARITAERWSAERLIVQEQFAEMAANFTRTPPSQARVVIDDALMRLAQLIGSPATSFASIVDTAVDISYEWKAQDTPGPAVVWRERFPQEVLRQLHDGKTSIQTIQFGGPWTFIIVPIPGTGITHVTGLVLAGEEPLRLDSVTKLLTAFADMAGSLLARAELQQRSERQSEARVLFRTIRHRLSTTDHAEYARTVSHALSEIEILSQLLRISILDVGSLGAVVRHSSLPATVGNEHLLGSDSLIDLATSRLTDRGHVRVGADAVHDAGANYACQFPRFGTTSMIVAWGEIDELAEASLNRLVTLFTELDRRLETERYALAAFENSPTGALICDARGLIVRCNQAFANFVGYSTAEELTGLACFDLYGSDENLFSDEPHQFAFQNRTGEPVVGVTRSVQIEGHESGSGVWLVHVEDVTEQSRSEHALRHQATHDELTGMLNRRALNERCEAMLAGDASLAVLLLDVDRFKLINDSLGHDSGDELLIEIARRVQLTARLGDTVARIGGDEFGIAIAGPTTLAQAQERAEELLQFIAAPYKLGRQQIYPSASIGIAVADADAASTFQELLRRSDAAMYRAKAKGRNRYETFDRVLSDQIMARMATEAGLRRALVNDELRVHYQPEVSLTDGRLLGAEALIRWKHPDQGLLPAAAFIDVAEDTGVIVDIGALVLYEACTRAATWPQPLAVRVNFSAAQLQRSDTVTLVRTALDVSGLPASRLCVEITESAMMADIERAESILGELRRLGVSIAVDDFGTGFSSLAYLKRFPVDTLKIDRAFVQDIGTEEGRAFIRAIVSLADALGLDVVAEGVETQEEADSLVELGCTRAQGYFFGRPAPEAALRSLFA